MDDRVSGCVHQELMMNTAATPTVVALAILHDSSRSERRGDPYSPKARKMASQITVPADIVSTGPVVIVPHPSVLTWTANKAHTRLRASQAMRPGTTQRKRLGGVVARTTESSRVLSGIAMSAGCRNTWLRVVTFSSFISPISPGWAYWPSRSIDTLAEGRGSADRGGGARTPLRWIATSHVPPSNPPDDLRDFHRPSNWRNCGLASPERPTSCLLEQMRRSGGCLDPSSSIWTSRTGIGPRVAPRMIPTDRPGHPSPREGLPSGDTFFDPSDHGAAAHPPHDRVWSAAHDMKKDLSSDPLGTAPSAT